MNQAEVIVADYNAIVVEMLENNADPLAGRSLCRNRSEPLCVNERYLQHNNDI